MMVTVYVDWESHEILTKEQFEEEVEGLVANIKDDNCEYDGRLYNFLEEKHLDIVDLFHTSEADKMALRKEFEEWLVGDAETQLLEEVYDEVKLEL
jgi:hypothetical protein